MSGKIFLAICIFTLMPVVLYALSDSGNGYTAHYESSNGLISYDIDTGTEIGTSMFRDGTLQVMPYEEDGEYYFPLVENLIRGNLSFVKSLFDIIKTVIKEL